MLIIIFSHHDYIDDEYDELTVRVRFFSIYSCLVSSGVSLKLCPISVSPHRIFSEQTMLGLIYLGLTMPESVLE